MKNYIRLMINKIFALGNYELVKSHAAVLDQKDESASIGLDNSIAQRSLSLFYSSLLAQNLPLPKLTDVGFRVHSQTDEDGILLFLFSVIGTTNKIFVEIGTGSGVECNSANLAINFGWHGLFVDGNEKAVEKGVSYYGTHPDTWIFPPQFVPAIITRDNVNSIIAGAGFQGEIDLLSIDVDGMDYWIWDAIDCVNPRVVVIEANGKFGTRSITVPYSSDWAYDPKTHPHYHGASLVALTKLANKKGYRLVGANRFGYNAFYLREDISCDELPAVSVEACRLHPTRENDERIFKSISHLPYEEV